jgi:hypothetical protein
MLGFINKNVNYVLQLHRYSLCFAMWYADTFIVYCLLSFYNVITKLKQVASFCPSHANCISEALLLYDRYNATVITLY